jgi:hypothetical protein
MTFTPIQAHITNQQQLANGLTEEKPAASTNVDCNRTVCVERAPNCSNTVTETCFAEQLLGRQTSPPAFIAAINGKFLPGKQCGGTVGAQTYVTRDGVEYIICTPNNTNTQVPPPEATKPAEHGGTHIPGNVHLR